MKRFNHALILLYLLLLCSSAYADMGVHPQATIDVSLDGHPVEQGLVSVQVCHAQPRQVDDHYSLAGIGSLASFDSSALYGMIRDDESARDDQDVPIKDVPFDEKQRLKAQEFVNDTYDPIQQCYWQPAERAFTHCQGATCTVSYMVPAQFRVAVLDLEQGRTYASQLITREGQKTTLRLDFNSSTGGVNVDNRTELPWILLLGLYLVNLFIEVAVAITMVRWLWHQRIGAIIWPALIGNALTHPIVLAISFTAVSLPLLSLLILEFIVIGIEAALYKKLATLSWKNALLLSAAANAMSLAVGLAFQISMSL